MKDRMLSRSAVALAISGLLLVVPVFAEEVTDASDAQSTVVPRTVSLPECLADLELSREQQGRIAQIVREYDEDMEMVWKQFGSSYLDTIRTEALLLTAIEDNLLEGQRKQVREQRRRTVRRQESNHGTAMPVSEVGEEIATVGVSLTANQEASANMLQEKYLGRLRSLDRDIQGLHIRLVSLEADKLVEIENILSQDQLLRLREVRQNAPTRREATSRSVRPE
jgi:hypothetical protein